MKTILCALIAALFCSVGAHAQTKQTPISYNDELASITDSLYVMGTQWGNAFQEINSGDKDYSKLSAHRRKMTAFISRKVSEVERKKAPGVGGEGLKSSMLSFLRFEKEMIDKAFQPMEQLNASSSQATVDAAIQKLTDEAEKEGAVLQMVNAAQEAYGKQNGFTIESASENEE